MRDKKSAAMFLLPGRYLNTKLNSCKANAQRASLALLGAASVRKARGLWSEKTVILDRNTHDQNLLRAQMTANASLSIVDHRVWVGVSFELAKEMGHSTPFSVH